MLRAFDEIAAAGRDVTLDADVVVVGSGAGGGAIAAELAEGGRSVVVVEEGGHYTSKDFALDAPTMIKKLYRNAGSAPILGRPNIIFSEGRCVGGSTVINGAMSWRTPEKVLKRWQWEHGLAELSPEALDPFFTKVEERVSVGPQDPESIGEDARLMQRGADKLGYAWVPAMRSQKHCCGANNCAFGCPTDAKQSVLVTYVPRLLAAGGTPLLRLQGRARAHRRTARHRRQSAASAIPSRARADRSSTVRAKVVVLACGAVQTPVLLLRNGLTNSSGQVGRNFLCHPNAKVVGVYDQPIHAWKGTIQGNQIREFIDEGIMITTSMVPPGLLAMSFPYFGARSWEVMRDYDKMLAAGCLVEDTGSGRVGVDLLRRSEDALRHQRSRLRQPDPRRRAHLGDPVRLRRAARAPALRLSAGARVRRRDQDALRASDPEG